MQKLEKEIQWEMKRDKIQQIAGFLLIKFWYTFYSQMLILF